MELVHIECVTTTRYCFPANRNLYHAVRLQHIVIYQIPLPFPLRHQSEVPQNRIWPLWFHPTLRLSKGARDLLPRITKRDSSKDLSRNPALVGWETRNVRENPAIPRHNGTHVAPVAIECGVQKIRISRFSVHASLRALGHVDGPQYGRDVRWKPNTDEHCKGNHFSEKLYQTTASRTRNRPR